ncbi:MAG: hypothetical protein DRO67_05890 [Candidatus Asgardarchaeum californiense]|nr:MAG: hypothetical protein DRO67_05890 [Candidatus Asgardarchaeum californiense]
MSSHKDEIEKLREEIKRLTEEIIKLVYKRNKIAKKIAVIKLIQGLPIKNQDAEEQLKKYVIAFCRNEDLPEKLALDILHFLIEKSIEAQQEVFIKMD